MTRPSADNGPDNQSPVTDPLMPDEDTLLDYINSYPASPSLRDIAKAFKIGQDRRASLRLLLRDMANRGLLASKRLKIANSDTLPEVTVLVTSRREGPPERTRRGRRLRGTGVGDRR